MGKGAAGVGAWKVCVWALGRVLRRLSRGCRRLRDLPQLHRKIIARGGEARPIGRPGYSIYAVRMAAIGADKVAGSSIPDLYTLIGASGGDARPIGRPGCRDYISSMTPIGPDKPAAARIPHLD